MAMAVEDRGDFMILCRGELDDEGTRRGHTAEDPQDSMLRYIAHCNR